MAYLKVGQRVTLARLTVPRRPMITGIVATEYATHDAVRIDIICLGVQHFAIETRVNDGRFEDHCSAAGGFVVAASIGWGYAALYHYDAGTITLAQMLCESKKWNGKGEAKA
jgi:hypothetical protein